MKLLTTPAEALEWSRSRHREGCTIGLVPTMGALHDGHLALVRDAAERADSVCVSIFVNPLQFNEGADFDSYPRPIDEDVAACAEAGVDAVYAPTGRAMYSTAFQTRVVPGALAEQMEGAMRPGHFEGVATVVTKLFTALRPDVAVFGQKDYQQLVIVRRLVADLDLGVEIVGHPIERDPDGLAMSSRNLRLTPEQRTAAVCVPRSLTAATEAARAGRTPGEVVQAAVDVIAAEPLARHEYTTVFDPRTLCEVDQMTDGLRIATAVWFGDVRLIDNRDLA
jgi:pantoate--beta-alanine ligase